MNLERWNGLKQRYAAMDDAELQDLRNTYDDLTPEGQDVLKREMDARGLPWDIAPVEELVHDDTPDLSAYTPEERRQIIATGGAVLNIPLEDQAFTGWLFEKHGIEFAYSRSGFDGQSMAVAPADLQQAFEVFSNASQAERDEFEVLANTEPEPLDCPACNSEDIMVEGVDDAGNSQWLCNTCDHRWTDADLIPNQA